MPFAVAAVVTGDKELLAVLRYRAALAAADSRTDVLVGYDCPYALPVHEAVGMVLQGQPRPSGIGAYWDPQDQAQAKFLEEPARTHLYQMSLIAAVTAVKVNLVQRGFGFYKVLEAVGTYLLNVSKRLVPVETGELRRSCKLERHRR